MLTSPPHPGFSPKLQDIAREAKWTPVVGSELGRIEGHTLTVDSDDGGCVRWVAVAGDALPKDYAPRLITGQAYTALREGDVEQDEVIAWQGKRWRLRDAWDGSRLVAKLAPA